MIQMFSVRLSETDTTTCRQVFMMQDTQTCSLGHCHNPAMSEIEIPYSTEKIDYAFDNSFLRRKYQKQHFQEGIWLSAVQDCLGSIASESPIPSISSLYSFLPIFSLPAWEATSSVVCIGLCTYTPHIFVSVGASWDSIVVQCQDLRLTSLKSTSSPCWEYLLQAFLFSSTTEFCWALLLPRDLQLPNPLNWE